MPRWVHAWAVLTACATFCLLGLGAVVTTLKVGMADPVWPTAPWYLAFISWTEPSPGFLIEHTHRAAGYLVGCLFIVLTVGLLMSPRVRRLGWVCLPAIVVQGLIGGSRVLFHVQQGPNLALVHGSFAQVVFGLSVAVALATSASWGTPTGTADLTSLERLGRPSLVCVLLIFVQIVLGGLIRHLNSPLGQRGHLITAFLVVIATGWLLRSAYELPALDAGLRRALVVFALLLAVQVLLGVEAWMTRFIPGVFPDAQPVTMGQAVIRTAHYLVGSAVFATAVLVAMQAHRPVLVVEPQPAVGIGRLEGAV